MQHNNYFSHIDGLRALAVILVVLFHYKIPGFSGGYIGVDIFFVISGFLITRILQNKYERKECGLWKFYKKRFYRIYPALLITTLLTFVSAVILFSPIHLMNLSQSLMGAMSFTSNFVYWKNIGYFQILDNYDPFVPTWSLSIEIQYYLLFPPIYYVLLKLFKNNMFSIVLLGVVVSIILCEIFLKFTSNFVYYNLPFRFFEFGIGSLCYYIIVNNSINRLNTYPFPIIGTILILLSVFFLDSSTPFPGLWALLPCIGSALIIVSKDRALFLKVYSNKVASYIGKISYSTYLIHWPLYVMFSYWYYAEIQTPIKICLILVAIVLSSLVYKFVENSYRGNNVSVQKRIILFILSISVFVCAYMAYLQNGWTWRLTDYQNELLHQISMEDKAFKLDFDQKFPLSYSETKFNPEEHSGLECSYNNTNDYTLLTACLAHNLIIKKGGSYLIIGDSNGANTYRSLEIAYPDISFGMLQQAGCAATSYKEDNRSDSWCFKDLPQILDNLYKKNIIDGVILSSRWVLQPYKNLINDIRDYELPVMVVGPTPMLRHDTFETIYMLGAKDYSSVQSLPMQEPYFYNDIINAEFFLSNLPDVTYVSKASLLCKGGICEIFVGEDKKPLFLDDQHLSSYGIRYMADLLRDNDVVKSFLSKE